MSQARNEKVAAAVASIRAFHALGRSLPEKQSPKDGSKRGAINAEARERGVNPDTLRKARQFADPGAGYTPAELGELCRLVESVQTGQDDAYSVFGRTHVIRLLSMTRRRRAGLQGPAVQGGWSVGRLEAEVAARYGSRRDGGRRPPADLLGLLAQAERMCEGWRRWAAALAHRPDWRRARPAAPTLADLPPEVTRLALEAEVAVARLHAAASAEFRARRPGRGVRRQFREAEAKGGPT